MLVQCAAIESASNHVSVRHDHKALVDVWFAGPLDQFHYF